VTSRRFPPPWTIDEAKNACFIVRDSTGQALGYFYCEDEAGRRSAAKLLTKDEARRMAVDFAKLPDAAAEGARRMPRAGPALAAGAPHSRIGKNGAS
jgi:hypothetical protein